MKITYFRLKGYIKVLNGMGLEEISLDFSQFKNRIVLIQGENGCSKSTIVSALSPNPDTSDSYRTDVFIDQYGNRQIIEYPAEKEIHYIGKDESGNDAYYQILIKSIVDDSKTRRTTKAFISKNGVELNPNGNVSSFKEIRDTELGIDPTYLDLSSISAENRGIVDMIPSDRRKYMASYIGSLDTYNNIFKTVSKKANSLKSYMNTLNSKIYELGNENEMRLNLMQLESNLKSKNKEHDDLIKSISEAETTIKMIDPNNEMQNLYESILERVDITNTKIKDIICQIESIYKETEICDKNSDLESLISESNSLLVKYESSLMDIKNSIQILIGTNDSLSHSLDKDRITLNEIDSEFVHSNIESVVNDLQKEIDEYKKYISDELLELFKSISIDDLKKLKESLNSMISNIGGLEDAYDLNQIHDSIIYSLQNPNCNYQNEINNRVSQNMISSARIDSLNIQIESLEKELNDIREFDSLRPKDCHIDNCPYISKYVILFNNKDKKELEYNKMIEEVKSLEESIKHNLEEIDIFTIRQNICNSLNSNFVNIVCFDKIILTIKTYTNYDLSHLINFDSIKKLIMEYHWKPTKEINIIDSLIEKGGIITQLQEATSQMNSLDSELKLYKNNKKLRDMITDSISKKEKEYNDNQEKITSLSRDCTFTSNLINNLNSKLSNLTSLLECKKSLNEAIETKENLKIEFDSVKNKIKIVKTKVDELNEMKNQLMVVEESISPLTETINSIKYNLTNIMSYQSEFKEISSKYEKIVFIRNACSPGNGLGIQSEYIKRYMNDIIIDCNKMLGFMFNGQIQLEVPLIDEKHFSIPFIGPNGIPVPDISCGSTAQKCMIGLVFSCVAMMKSSLRYNIPRFDEIDGGLDQQNRIMFINVLENILNFMQCEQCVIVSHNMEFDTQNTTRLMCSHSGIEIVQ